MSELLVAVDGVLEDSQHQQPLALQSTCAPESRKVLSRKQNVWLKQARQTVMSTAREAPLSFCNHFLPSLRRAVAPPSMAQPTQLHLPRRFVAKEPSAR